MCISRVSNNIFPFDSKPTSIVATSSLVVAVVAGVLTGVAYALNWGIPAMCACGTVSGCTALIAFAIICCKKTPVHNRLPPSQLFPEAFSSHSTQSQDRAKNPSERIIHDLYLLVKKGDLQTFKKAAEMYDKEEFKWNCCCSASIFLDEDDITTSIEGNDRKCSGQTLFYIILMQKDQQKKEAFLKVLLENFPDHSVEIQRYFLEQLLITQSQEIIDLLFKKMNKITNIMLETALKLQNLTFVDSFYARWPNDTRLRKECGMDRTCNLILKAPIDKNLKLKYLNIIAAQEKSTLETFTLKCNMLWINRPNSESLGVYVQDITFLHLAISAKQLDLVQLLASMKPLIEKPAISQAGRLTPLLQAVLQGNLEIVNILLKANANPNISLARGNGLYSCPRHDATHSTPLMIAASMGRQDIVDALLKNGADPEIKDGPDDQAWTMQDYANHFAKNNRY